MYKEIETQIQSFNKVSFSQERVIIMQTLIDFIQSKKDEDEPINLNFICTHNSRRSHLCQIWAQTIAYYFNIQNVYCYSGGTEATALFPKVVSTLEATGFQISKLFEAPNSIYAIKYDDGVMPIIGFSKKYDNSFNPGVDFAAVMTCGHADENCPLIPSAKKRISFTFEDPKVFDGTALQNEKYKERSLEIGSQLYYVFSKIQ